MNFIQLDDNRMINLDLIMLIKRDTEKRKIVFYGINVDDEVVVNFDNERQLNEIYEQLEELC